MKEIALSRGLVALVDDEDYELLSAYKWSAKIASNGSRHAYGHYACRNVWTGNGCITLRMHRIIVCAPAGMDVDHINGDRLDNRRANLRLATRSQNCRNKGPQTNNRSGFKGVSWHKATKRWIAAIHTNGRQRYLGVFNTPDEAHAAYCAAAAELHQEFARTA